MAKQLDIVEAVARADWVNRISTVWEEAGRKIFETGQLLVEAKAALPHGEFELMVENDMPFSTRHARRLMAIAKDERLSNRTHVSDLPRDVMALYELTRLQDEDFEQAVKEDVVRSDAERSTVVSFVKRAKRRELHADLVERSAKAAQELGRKLYPVVCGDFPWEDQTWSDEGMARHPANHYPTMSIDEIKALEVPALSHAIFFLWATTQMLDQQLDVLTHFGFRYVSHWIWDKGVAGKGHWSRGRHELLLIGRRGTDVGPPLPSDRRPSVWECPRGKHSEKPDEIYDYIARVYPGIDKLEMFARDPRPGWDVWGNETTEGAA